MDLPGLCQHKLEVENRWGEGGGERTTKCIIGNVELVNQGTCMKEIWDLGFGILEKRDLENCAHLGKRSGFAPVIGAKDKDVSSPPCCLSFI